MVDLPFPNWKFKSPIAAILPLLIQNLMLYFWVFADEPVILMVFFGLPIVYIAILSGVVGYEKIKDAWGFDFPSVWHGAVLVVFGIVLGFATYSFATFMSTFIGFKIVPTPESTYLSTRFLAYTPAYSTFWNALTFNILYFGVVAFGEELMVLYCMAGLANWFKSRFNVSDGASILSGAMIARILWSFTHWAAWISLGMEAIGNMMFAIIVGMLFFTFMGFIFRSREAWGNLAFKEFSIITPMFAHLVYDVIVATMSVI